MSELADLDELAGDLARAYQERGAFCCVIRTQGEGSEVRAIYPKVDVTLLYRWLHKAAETIFTGPAVVRERR